MTAVEFFVAGVPAPKGSMRGFVVGRRAILTSDNTKLKPWAFAVRAEALRVRTGEPIVGPVRVHVQFYLPRPKSLPARISAATKKPDLDKLLRGALDAISGVLFVDDAQVIAVWATKAYARTPAEAGAQIRVEALELGR